MSQTAQRRPPRRTRDEQRAEDAKRRADRRMRWIVLTVVGAVLLVLVGVAAMSQGDSGTTTTSNGKKAACGLPFFTMCSLSRSSRPSRPIGEYSSTSWRCSAASYTLG